LGLRPFSNAYKFSSLLPVPNLSFPHPFLPTTKSHLLWHLFQIKNTKNHSFTSINSSIMFALASLAVGLLATFVAGESRGITPHDMYSSSVGVLGCKINTNRVAYWPMSVDCENICVRVSYGGRSVDLLRIDQSGGAYDISYDAYNFLVSGQSATVHPITGGAVNMEVTNVPASNCVQHLKAGGLPLSASNSMNYVASCLSQPNSWVAKNYRLFNIQDPICKFGYDEQCTVNLAVSNQPSCPHALGATNGMLPTSVWNIQYGTGAVVPAP
jgi:hypothetical protein